MSCIIFIYNPLFSLEYVNAQEPLDDMKSITDRAAQTLLWTELFRGQYLNPKAQAQFLN